MPNISPFQCRDAIKAIIESVSDSGPVLIDPRFTADDSELYRLIADANKDNNYIPKGWLLVWDEMPTQERTGETTCAVTTDYVFALAFLYPYANQNASDLDDEDTSRKKFETVIWNVSEALNEVWDLGLGNLVMHFGLITTEAFTQERWGQSAGGGFTHFGVFRVLVQVENSY